MFKVYSVSPLGRGAIHVLYVTHAATDALRTVFRGARVDAQRVRYGQFVDADGDVIDDGMVIPTRDGYLLTVHGNPLIVERLGEALGGAGGTFGVQSPWVAEGAEGGESVAAAAYDLMPRARTPAAVGFLLEQASTGMAAWTQRVHDGQHSPDPGEVAALLSDAPRARALFEPLRVVLAGVPNAGKSTLFNTLLGQRRVVTHSAPGTTRDVVEEEILVGAYPVVLRDGAGVRPAADPIEREGVDRMATAIAKSDLVVLLEPVAGPGSDPAAAHALAEAVADAQRAGRLLRVQSRVDEDPGPTSRGGLAVSGKTGAGVADLVAAMGERLFGGLEPPRGRPVPFTADLERWLQELAQKS